MLIDFFYHLRAHKLPVSVNEYLTLVNALRQDLMPPTLDNFYFLARATLVKDESLYDRYDKAFGAYYKGIAAALPEGREVPADWLIKQFEKSLTPEEKAAIQKHGWDKLMELFKQRLEEQKERHAGGNKWIGTGGTSPFGNGGYHPRASAWAATRPATAARSKSGTCASSATTTTRSNSAPATSRWRCAGCGAAREGAELELDLDDTIASTARNAGHLDLRMVPERHNTVKVLMLLDVGGSMDDHITRVEELFSAARSEFRNLDVYYFHNCPYESLWQSNRRRNNERFDTWDVLRKYNPDWRLIIVGDATMSPYEILQPGGSVEHYNAEPGALWLRRLLDAWPKSVWLNPEPTASWQYRQSIALLRDIMQDRMYPVTVAGLEQAMRVLSK